MVAFKVLALLPLLASFGVLAAPTPEHAAIRVPSADLEARYAIDLDSRDLEARSSAYVTRSGKGFVLNGKNYCFAGMNGYWVPQMNQDWQYDQVFAKLSSAGVRVLRTWAFSMVESTPSYDLTYFQKWSGSSFTVNTGSDGLQRMDKLLSYAGKYNIKVIMTLANNWDDYGSIDMYLQHITGDATYHSDFYTNSAVIAAYDSYVNAIVTRYKDNTNVFAWELGNEFRANGNNPKRPGFTAAQLTSWISARAAKIKAIDSNHMVAIGDEGYYAWSGSTDYIYDGDSGMDFDNNLLISNIDFGTFHLYPSAWGKSNDWGTTFIQQHISSMNGANKPVILEEFNVDGYSLQQSVLPGWIQTAVNGYLPGIMIWQLGPEFLGTSGTSVSAPSSPLETMDVWDGKAAVWSMVTSLAATMNARCPM